MGKNHNSKLTFVVVLAAVVAALTTVAVLFWRFRCRRKEKDPYREGVNYDLDDCSCDEDGCSCHFGGNGDEEDEAADDDSSGMADAPVQIPLADERDDAEDGGEE